MYRAIAFFFVISSLPCYSQPETEVYLADFLEGDNPEIINPKNISNNPGYDNQPSFWGDSKSLLYSRTVNGQTEIARYFVESGNTEIITNTPQGGEYSPTQMPDGRISSIRLDTTGLQLLYAYNLNGNPQVLVPELVIGYHAWISDGEIVTFVLGDPATMQLVNTKTSQAKVVAENIGRSLHKIPNSGSFSYVDKSGEEWLIKSMNPETEETLNIAKTLAGSEDYCWTPSGVLIMGRGSKLYFFSDEEDWQEFADLASNGVAQITRVSVSPDGRMIAIAGQ